MLLCGWEGGAGVWPLVALLENSVKLFNFLSICRLVGQVDVLHVEVFGDWTVFMGIQLTTVHLRKISKP